MSADMTSEEDLDDIAFRALLEPLALEVLPGRSPPSLKGASLKEAPPKGAQGGAQGDQARKVSEVQPGDLSRAGEPAHPDPLGSKMLLEDRFPPSGGAAADPASSECEVPPASRPPPLAAEPAPFDPMTSETLSEDWSTLLDVIPAHEVPSGLETLPEDWSTLPDAVPAQMASPATETLEENWAAPPAAAPAHLTASASEALPEDWSTPPDAVPGVPAPLALQGLPEDRSTSPAAARAHLAPLVSGELSESRWRLTIALPDHLAPMPSNAVPNGAPAPFVTPPVPPPATLAPPTAEARPYRSPMNTVAEGASRPNASPRLVARAGAAREVAALGRSSPQVVRTTVLPPARVRWSVVLLSGIASGLIVAGTSWLFGPPAVVDAPIESAATGHTDVASPALTPAAASEPRPAPTARPVPTPGATSSRTSEPSSTSTAVPTSKPAPAATQPAIQAPTSTPAPATASAATPVPTQPATAPQAMIGLLTQRGDAALAVGDIIAARLLYERAAALGSASAATAVGKTYDADFLVRADAHGIRADPVAAVTWYHKAAALGDPEARALLTHEAQRRP